ncbi:UNVERIFIED_CONTAM: hypothetical protein K2H54_020457 [Gekko kuhli]
MTPKALEGYELHDVLIGYPFCIPEQVVPDEDAVCKNQATAGDKPGICSKDATEEVDRATAMGQACGSVKGIPTDERGGTWSSLSNLRSEAISSSDKETMAVASPKGRNHVVGSPVLGASRREMRIGPDRRSPATGTAQ